MIVEKLSNSIDLEIHLKRLGVDGGGVKILANKSQMHIVHIKGLHVGGANILKQDALSIGADLAVPKGTVIALTPKVDCILIGTTKHLKTLAKKELAQPFGLKELAQKLSKIAQEPHERELQVMGIINANENSFYSESRFVSESAVVKIEEMIEQGASIIDVGGVSSAPNAALVCANEELDRVRDICDLVKEKRLYEKAAFSIDSYEPLVVEYALQSGFSIVNDITGLKNDAVCELAAAFNAKVVIMHMQGSPQTMQIAPYYENILSEIYAFFEEQIAKAERFGIKEIVLDVGIGFGKSLEDNLNLLRNLEHFASLQKPLLVGVSRKSFIDKIVPTKVEDRLAGTLVLHHEALIRGASILRVHDVKEHVGLVKIYQALQSI